jgi:hypothetical protein
VDALCIIQDSATDKAQEVVLMADIYRNAALTISAAVASTCHDGFLQKRDIQYHLKDDILIYLPFACQEGIGTVGLFQRSDPNVRDSISTRAWTFQEHMLSSRLLMYGSLDVNWICREAILPRSQEVKSIHDMRRMAKGILPTVRQKLNGLGTLSKVELTKRDWMEVIEEYSTRKLTFPDDKLPALSAIAESFKNVFEGSYVAGHWEHWLVPSLLWKCTNPQATRPFSYRAPPWSWASVEGGIKYMPDAHSSGNLSNQAARVVCEVTPKLKIAPYGEILDSRLVREATILEGKCRLGEFSLSDNMGYDGQPFTVYWDNYEDIEFEGDGKEYCLPLATQTSTRDGTNILGLILKEKIAGCYVRIGAFELPLGSAKRNDSEFSNRSKRRQIDSVKPDWLTLGELQLVHLV